MAMARSLAAPPSNAIFRCGPSVQRQPAAASMSGAAAQLDRTMWTPRTLKLPLPPPKQAEERIAVEGLVAWRSCQRSRTRGFALEREPVRYWRSPTAPTPGQADIPRNPRSRPRRGEGAELRVSWRQPRSERIRRSEIRRLFRVWKANRGPLPLPHEARLRASEGRAAGRQRASAR